MKLRTPFLVAAGILSLVGVAVPVTSAAPESKSQITILYDAFGTDPSMTKDWGFSALVEIAGKRILFDTGNDADIFAANVKAKGVDLKTLDFVVLSHRHSDHRLELCFEHQSHREDLRAQGRIRHLRFVAAVELLP